VYLVSSASVLPNRSFRDLILEGRISDKEYNTNDNDLLADFYTPILSVAKTYDRSTGAFSSSGIKALAYPLLPFIRNAITSPITRPVMRIVASHDISEFDYDQMSAGYGKKRATPDDQLITILENLKTSSDHELVSAVRSIGTMIQLGLLDIKVAIPAEKLSGMYHRKIGIFSDYYGKEITFEGSQNVSRSGDGSETNLEGLVAFCSEEPAMMRFKLGHKDFFNALWDDKLQNVRVRPLEKYPRELLASFGAPIETILKEINASSPRTIIPPRECQREAVLGWIQNGQRGILDMSTGSGKSRAALLALDTLKENPLNVIIAGSLKDLVNQWVENEILQMYDKGRVHIVRVSSEHGTREELEKRVNDVILDFKAGHYERTSKKVFIIATIQSASQVWFTNLFRKLEPRRLAVVFDEVHHAGASGPTGEVLKLDAHYRIGLSATWRRYDDDGNGRLEAYFMGKHSAIAYSYPLSRGIKDGILSEYKFFIHFVSMDPEDLAELRKRLQDYEQELQKVDPALGVREGDAVLGVVPEKKLPKVLELRNAWRSTIASAMAKTDVALKIVDEYGSDLKKCIIYCSDRQHLDRTAILMAKRHFDLEPYDSQVPEETRHRIRVKFGQDYAGEPLFIGAIKCLDEGIDLPALDSAILVSSNRTEREWIQRRGRILRKHPGKQYSIIHDVSMMPYTRAEESFPLTKQEIGYVEAELSRLESFASDAMNRDEAMHQIKELRRIFGLT